MESRCISALEGIRWPGNSLSMIYDHSSLLRSTLNAGGNFLSRRFSPNSSRSERSKPSLLTMTTDNLQHVENHMLLLGRKNSRERVAAFLLEMNGRLTAAGVIALPMKRRDIADYLGITLETVARALSDFQRKGYLKVAGPHQREIIVLNAAGLIKLNR